MTKSLSTRLATINSEAISTRSGIRMPDSCSCPSAKRARFSSRNPISTQAVPKWVPGRFIPTGPQYATAFAETWRAT